MNGFKIGDYVIADNAMYDDFRQTFVIVGFTKNRYGRPLVRVQDIAHLGKSSGRTSFYPHELSLEDGSQPA